eukprot:gene45693-56937_t
MYTVVVTVSLSSAADQSTTSSLSTVIQIGTSGVTAVISGGSSQTASLNNGLTLDASQSYDIDYPTTGILTYAWSCLTYSPTYGASCAISPPAQSRVGPQWHIEKNVLTVGTYTITATVYNSAGSFSSMSIQMTIVKDSIPSASIAGLKVKYNVNEKIVLIATLNCSTTALASWSSSQVNASLYATTPLNKLLAFGISTYQLGLRADSFVSGLSYTFQLQVAYASSVSVAATSVVVVMNSAPSGGRLSVTPTVGLALNTSYLLATSGWVDDLSDYPLSYILFYFVVDSSSLSVVKSLDQVSYVS